MPDTPQDPRRDMDADSGVPRDASADTASDSARQLRAHRTGTLLCDGTPWPRKFIIDGRDGTFVMPADRAFFEAEETVLWLPAERFDAIQALSSVHEIEDPYDEAKDRYLAYHGKADAARWARLAIESARIGGDVLDGDELRITNALRDAEPKLCKLFNTEPVALADLCNAMLGARPLDPLAVGVDEDGVDVRAGVGIMRLDFPRRARDADDALSMSRGLLSPPLDADR
ncbi:MAG: hypothetical protein AAF235_00185 [Planctomycetota bacterium]